MEEEDKSKTSNVEAHTKVDEVAATLRNVQTNRPLGERIQDAARDEEEKTRSTCSPPPHALASLLSCRQVNTEATLIAFRLYAHPVKFSSEEATTLHHLREQVALLPSPCRDALTHLALDLHEPARERAPASYQDICYYICSATKFSPRISKLLLRYSAHAPLVRRHRGKRRTGRLPRPPGEGEGKTCVFYAPHWFNDALFMLLTDERTTPWIAEWTVTWPLLHALWDQSATVPASQFCVGNCTAVLTQVATGRTVEITIHQDKAQ